MNKAAGASVKGKWEQGELLPSKAKSQVDKGQSVQAIETYLTLLALVQAQRKTLQVGNLKHKGGDNRSLELEAWQDLAYIYTTLGQWDDGDLCLDRAKGVKLYSSESWHAKEKLYEAQGLYKEALIAFSKALAIEPDHVPSLIYTAVVLKQLGKKALPAARSFVADALWVDPYNNTAWYNLGTVHKMEGFVQQFTDSFDFFRRDSIGKNFYCTIAKGPLVEEHVLMIPIEHLPSTLSLFSETNSEFQKYKHDLKRFFRDC